MSKELVPSFDSEVPKGWEVATIGDLISPEGVFIDGDWVESKDQDPNGNVRLLQLADIGDGFYKNKSSRFLTKEKALELNCTFLQKGDVLVARMPEPLGRACIFPGDERECVTVVDVCVIRTGIEDVNHKWLLYWVNSPRFRNTISSLQSGTTRRRISRGNLATITFPVPPPEQQIRIVAKIEELFSHIDAGIAALNKAKILLKQYRQSVLKAAVTGELTKHWREKHRDKLEPASQLLERILQERRQKWEAQQLEQFKAKGKVPKNNKWKEKYPEPNINVEKFFDEPESWSWAEIGTVTDLLSGHAFKKAEYTDSGVRLFQIANVSFGHTKWDEVEHLPESYLEDWKHLSLNEGDVLMALNRPLLSKRLKISRLSKTDVPAILYQRVGKFQFYSELISDYFLIYMQSHFYINRLEEQLQGVNIPFINKGKLLETPISIPTSVEETELIVEKVNSKLDSIGRIENEIESQLKKAVKNKQSILASAFSGDLVEALDSDGSAFDLLENIEQQRVSRATNKKLIKKKDSAKKKDDHMSKKKIIDILKASDKPLSPEKLFDLIDADGASPDEVEGFYIELKETLNDKNVVVEALIDNDIKQGDLISYKAKV